MYIKKSLKRLQHFSEITDSNRAECNHTAIDLVAKLLLQIRIPEIHIEKLHH